MNPNDYQLTPAEVEQLLRNLMKASVELLNAVRYKESFIILAKAGSIQPYEEVLANAIESVIKAIQEAGKIHLAPEVRRIQRDRFSNQKDN